ncbi:glycoside hydrolase family 32 protein [Bacillus gobiensis]|uniref:GH32 C-terminal domain-containing protein n=1 Tax=Bacillus gobiensis TaxID=1441095 RepID=UPI003D1ABE9D
MNKKKIFIFSLVFVLCIASGITTYYIVKPKQEAQQNDDVTKPPVQANSYYNELYRPQFHYSPEANWMNDPNGMVFHKGEYHLFYQYHPYDSKWGPMHWGHAVSKDLVHWEHRPVAFAPDHNGDIFSGSIVVDHNNTSGFGKDALVALYTQNKDGHQVQSLAYSTDDGNTWTKYEGNPIMKDFPDPDWRDPKVFWHEETKSWIMPLAAKDKVMLYTSPNLKDWSFASEYKPQNASGATLLECPELFPLPVDGEKDKQKWVLTTSLGDGAIAGGSGMEYYVGTFDGKTFTPDKPEAEWLDYGADFYAGVTWENAPNNDQYRTMIAWMSNWKYANDTPTSAWRSAMTVPRKLELKTSQNGEVKLVQSPIQELETLRRKEKSYPSQVIKPNTNFLANAKGDIVELVADFKVDEMTTSKAFGFRVRKGDDQATTIGYNNEKKTIYLDRSFSGESYFNDQFAKVHEAPLEPVDGHVKMRILVDRSSVELFGNDGQVSITDQIFPKGSSDGIELFSSDGDVTLESLHVYPLNRIWGNSLFHSNLSGWEALNGRWADTISGTQGSDTVDSFKLADSRGKDFTYETDVKIGNQGAGGLVFRSDKTAKNAYVATIDQPGQMVKLWKKVDGEASILATYPAKIDPETTNHLKVTTEGKEIKVHFNDQLAIRTKDNSLSSGYFGLNVWNGTSTFQNVNTYPKK